MVFRDRPETPSNAHRATALQIGIRYRLTQNMESISETFNVQTDEGNAAFKIEFARRDLVDVLVVRDMNEIVRCLLPGPQSTPEATEILGGDGRALARVTRTPISAVRDRFEVDIESGGFWLVIGDVGSREFTLDSSRGQIAEVSRRWFRLPESFGVEVAPGQDAALVLAAAVTIDLLAHGFEL